jgi:hypothetical protein
MKKKILNISATLVERQSHPRLRWALMLIAKEMSKITTANVLRVIVWELMRTQTKLKELKEYMDKKMHQVTKRMEIAEKDIKHGKGKAAVKVLKKAEKRNEKLVKIDRTVRDPLIKKAKAIVKEAKK